MININDWLEIQEDESICIEKDPNNSLLYIRVFDIKNYGSRRYARCHRGMVNNNKIEEDPNSEVLPLFIDSANPDIAHIIGTSDLNYGLFPVEEDSYILLHPTPFYKKIQ
jgi:hypothetical protein